jgi:hypothetical protein
MPINLFISKKTSTPKGNTIKKSEPIDGRQTRRDTHAEDNARITSAINLLSVTEWLKESTIEGPELAKQKELAGLSELKVSRLPRLILENAAQAGAVSKKATAERSSTNQTQKEPEAKGKEPE